MKAYVRLFEENAPFLQSVRDEDIRGADTAASIRAFDQAFRIALRDIPVRETSGLVEWQKYVLRWRDRNPD
jgi:hypothetical protein